MGTKEQILKNAFILFLHKGFTDVSINEIAIRTGIAKGGFYHHFKSKDDLITEVMDLYICPFFAIPIANMKTEFDQEHGALSPYEKLRAYYTMIPPIFIPDFTEEEAKLVTLRDFYFLVFEGMKKYEYLSTLRYKFYKEKLSLLTAILEQGMAEGQIKKAKDASELATTIIALKDGILSLHLLDESIDIKEKYFISFQQLWQEIKLN